MSLRGNGTIGLLREVKSKWERRVPLAPSHVKELVSQGVRVLVQPSDHRIFSNKEYHEAGAIVQEDISAASTILGVKQVRIEDLIPERSYMFFSHTIKGQSENMPLLDYCLKNNIRLFDYECILADGEKGKPRLVAFGRYAGIAGMIDFFKGFGERMLSLGYNTPFLNVPQSFVFKDLEAAYSHLKGVGNDVKTKGLPASVTPLTFVFTGQGNVTKGALEVFQCFPHKMVQPHELASLCSRTDLDPGVLIGTVVTAEHMVAPLDASKKYDRHEYFSNPQLYKPVFHETILPYTSVIANCMYWDGRYPRLITNKQIQELQTTNKKLLGVADVTCDIEGSIEFLQQCTTIENPFFIYDPVSNTITDNMDAPGVMMLGVDYLPAELPFEASMHFGNQLLPFIPQLANSDGSVEFEKQTDLPPELRSACIASHGKLTPAFAHIAQLRAQSSAQGATAAVEQVQTRLQLRGHLFDSGLINKALDIVELAKSESRLVKTVMGSHRGQPTTIDLHLKSDGEEALRKLVQKIKTLAELDPLAEATVSELPKESWAKAVQADYKEHTSSVEPKSRVLVLGSGFVVGPAVAYLLRRQDRHVTVASGDLAQARRLTALHARSTAVHVDASNEDEISKLVASHDLVISLLPAPFHPIVAKFCLKHEKNMVTSSYVSPALQACHEEAKAKGLVFLNEVGLDPGIDHMTAMKVIHEHQAKGDVVESFRSVCGGLPAPEAADNPLGYKFSWNPKGVLTASQNPARYLQNGEVVEIAGPRLLYHAQPITISRGFSLECLPNRDSIVYRELYGLANAHTIFRGTLRYAGFSGLMRGLLTLGFFNGTPNPALAADQEPITWMQLSKKVVGAEPDVIRDTCRRALSTFSEEFADRTVEAMAWLGMFSEEPVALKGTVVDAFCHLLEQKLAYGENENDMCLLQHQFGIKTASGVSKTLTSVLCMHGDKHGTSMSKAVGIPTAIAADLVETKVIKTPGVHRPVLPEIFYPILDKLEREGFTTVDRWV